MFNIAVHQFKNLFTLYAADRVGHLFLLKCFMGKQISSMGGSPGLVVMGRDSCSEGCGFKSRHRILDGHFSHIFVVKIVNVCLKRPKINEKEAGVGPFFLKKEQTISGQSYIMQYNDNL